MSRFRKKGRRTFKTCKIEVPNEDIDYENGISKPPRDRLLVLAKFFDMPVEKIIGKNNAAEIPEAPKEAKIHGNKRTAKLIQAFEELSETEQRVILNQTQALAEKRKNGNGTAAD